ncbi:MAG TPA: fatty acid CoA ligase family protein [Opitutaceae bacterium]|jgi:acyl-CoA synthetase (AMP-forming)/AMP-acid ligase II|nr:fatty acid CoA ligase family protein [Opitutaceae bacterium]
MVETANIARHLAFMAARAPAQPALKIPRGRTRAGDIDYLALTFAELAAETAAWRAHLAARGVRPGDRALVMVRPGLPLIASVFALFALGAVPVIIDPGMGRKNFLTCVARSRPRVLVGVPLAQILSHVFRRPFRSVEMRVAVSGKLTARLSQPSDENSKLEILIGGAATDLAAVLFTSGSTGAPKGVCYEHGMFEAQIRLVRETYGIEPGEIDLPLLPVFALFNPALGFTTIVPELDPRRPAAADPAKMVQAIRQENITSSFGSPTLWRKIASHCLAQKITLPSLRRVLCAGAPVPADLWKNSRSWLPNGRLHSPYGATEALPISTVSADEIEPASVRGACVGRPLPGLTIRIIAINEAPIASVADVRVLPSGEIGEVIVRGPVVTKIYDALPQATAAAKIQDGDTVWHRMGDCGYFDEGGRLWFCGRMAERVETTAGPMFTEPCEQVFRAHPQVMRCALIGLGSRGAQQPALVVEGKPKSAAAAAAFARELRALAQMHPHTAAINSFYFHPQFPVDVRHNAKIHRLALARWAATAKGFMPALGQ